MRDTQHAPYSFGAKSAGADSRGRGVVWIHAEPIVKGLPLHGEIFFELRDPHDVEGAKALAAILNERVKGISFARHPTKTERRDNRAEAEDVCTVCGKWFPRGRRRGPARKWCEECQQKAATRGDRRAYFKTRRVDHPELKLRRKDAHRKKDRRSNSR